MTGFEGPFAAGPPPEALATDAPPLSGFRLRELWRLVVVAWVLSVSVARALGRRALGRGDGTWPAAACEGLVDAFIRLGPTAVKGGQIIASSGALFPAVLADAARRCLDAVPAFPVEHVRAAIAADLGHGVDVLFASFDPVPLSAASIGQVHACVLSDGRDAVVKVQRPGIREQMTTDLRVGYRLAWLIERTPWGRRTNAREIVRDLHGITFEELNPAREAWQQHRFRQQIGAFGDNAGITAPEVYWDYCGPRVICMERVYGMPMDDFEEMEARGIDGQAILRQGAKVWAESVMIHGPFHGDMHAGNMWVLEDGRGCYLDFGIMGELPDEWKQVVKDLFYTCSFDLDFVRVARAYRRVGAIPASMGTDEELGAVLNEMLGPILVDGFGNLDIAQLVAQSLELLKAYQAAVPKELVLVAKQLLYVDKYTRFLAPTYSLTSDPFIVKNIFPEAAAAKAADLGVSLDGPAPLRALAGPAGSGFAHPDGVSSELSGSSGGGGAMRYVFLSDEWIDRVRQIGEEYRQEVMESVDVPAQRVRLNLVVTDVPFGDGRVLAHLTSADGVVEVELGHAADVDVTVTVDHDTARAMVVDQDPKALMRSFLMGHIRVDGDLSTVLGPDADPMALMRMLDLGAEGALGDLDPLAGAIGARIKAVTA